MSLVKRNIKFEEKRPAAIGRTEYGTSPGARFRGRSIGRNNPWVYWPGGGGFFNDGAAYSEPFADAAILPTYLLSRFARGSVTVALGGDGSDELLAGYPTFQAEAAARWYRLPRAVHERIVQPAARLLPVSTGNFSRDFKVKRFYFQYIVDLPQYKASIPIFPE